MGAHQEAHSTETVEMREKGRRRRYGPQELRVAIKDARTNYEAAEAESSSSAVTAYRLGYLRGLQDALASVKWEEHGLGRSV